MLKNRLIAVVIVRDGGVVQSIKFKHTNVIHYDAIHAIESFNRWSVDEIALVNVSLEKSSQEKFRQILEHVSCECFVPLTAGGWIDSFEYGLELMNSGADKIMLNSAVDSDPELVTRLANHFGSQSVVASIDVVSEQNKSEVFVDRGTKATGVEPELWAQKAQDLGAGEIFFNSVTFDGARKGYDLKNLQKVCESVSIPVIAFGGAFRWKHFVEGFKAGADAVAAANIFHYTEQSTKYARRHIHEAGIPVRLEGMI